MKSLLFVLVLLMYCSVSYSQEWVPMVVNITGYVPYTYSVTNYYTEWKPVNIPVVRYFPIQPQPLVQPVIFVQPRSCLFWWNHRPYYYVYPNIYQYFPARY